MDSATRALLRDLMSTQTLLSLAVVANDSPVIGLLPFAADETLSSLWVHASRLARHSRGLEDGAPFAALIQAPDALVTDPLQRPRLTLEGTTRALDRGSAAWREGRDRYLAKLPSAEVTFGLGDFTLYRLTAKSGRFVTGFAGAHTLTPTILERVAREAS